MKSFCFYVTLLLLFVPDCLYAGDADNLMIRFRQYNIQDELISNEINSIHQDRKGFIWFGGSNGLSRFDGCEFTHFRSNSGPDGKEFSSNTILCIGEDSRDRLWLATPLGLNVFDLHTQSVSRIDNELLAQDKINTLLVVNDETILVGCSEGLYVYDVPADSVWRFVPRNSPAEIKQVRNLYRDSRGNIWIGRWKRGFVTIDLEQRRLIDREYPGLESNLSITCFKEDHLGNMCVGTWGNGLIYIENPLDPVNLRIRRLITSEKTENHVDWNMISDINVDAQNNLWIGSPNGLRIVAADDRGFTPRKFSPIDNSNRYKSHYIQKIFQDKNGVMWMSDFGSGIITAVPYKSEIMEVDLRRYGLQRSAVTAIYQASDSVLWLGLIRHVMAAYDLKTNKLTRSADPMLKSINGKSNAVVGFAEIEQTGQVFLATRYYGVYELQKSGSRIAGIRHIDTHREPVRNLCTNAIVKDADNNVWIATRGGVVILEYDARTKSHRLVDPDGINELLEYHEVSALYVDSSGAVWIGTNEFGLSRLVCRNGKIEHFKTYNTRNKGIGSNKIRTVYEDSRHRVWAGTQGGGLCLYDGKADCFGIIKNIHLVSSDTVMSIVEDDAHNLWLATNSGLVCYNPDVAQGDIKKFGSGNGLSNKLFIGNSSLKLGGKIVLGGYDGLTIFDPHKLMTEKIAASPAIVDIQIFNKSLNQLPGERRDKITRVLPPYTRTISLTHRDYSVSIKYVSPNFENNAQSRYA